MLTIARPAGEEGTRLVLCGRPRRAVGRIKRDETDRAMGRARHDRDPEPRLRVSGFPGCAGRVARELARARRRGRPVHRRSVHGGDPRDRRGGNGRRRGVSWASGQATLRPYEQVEWTNAEQDAWLLEQAYEGMLRAVETRPNPQRDVLLGKTAAAGLAEDCLRRLTRIMGGGSFARHSPFGFWFEDVRALGFLRPPWSLAYDALFASSFTSSGSYFGR